MRKNNSRRFRAAQKFADGVNNPLLRTGTYQRNTFNATGYMPEFTTLNRQQLEWAYQTSWLCQLAVDVVAQDMTREGVDINDSNPQTEKRVNDVFDNYRLWDSVSDAIKWSRLYGGAIAVILIDGDDMSMPLTEVKPNTFRGLYVFDRWQLGTAANTTNLIQELGREFGKPTYYVPISENSDVQLKQDRIHHSRVLRFDGRRLPFYLRQSYQGWGASILEPVWSQIRAFDLASQSVAQMISKAYLRYYKVPNLSGIMTNSLAREGFLKQMDAMREFQNIEGLTIGDREDEFQVFNYNFGGLPEVLLQLGQQVSGGFGIPLVRLFGQSPLGFNSTGESDVRNYYDSIKQRQDTELRSNINRLLNVIYQSIYGKKPTSDFTFEFKNLWQMDTGERAAVAQTSASTILSALAQGALKLPAALKELKAISDTVGIFSTISDEDIAEAEAQEAIASMNPPDAGQNSGKDQKTNGLLKQESTTQVSRTSSNQANKSMVLPTVVKDRAGSTKDSGSVRRGDGLIKVG